MPPVIMHVDMDAFFASVEQQVNPALRGKPVIIGGRNNKYRSIICAASYEAKALGVTNAMPSWQALKICPQAVFVPADTAKYVFISEEIYHILQAFSPQVEKNSIDEFFLDISGCERLLGSIEKIGKTIKQRIKQSLGITCSIGVAPTRITAKLAAKLHKPDGLCILDREAVCKILATLPVEKICGIGSRLKRRLNRLGIVTCGQLADYPEQILAKHFGINGLWLKAVCGCQGTDTVAYDHLESAPPKSVGHSQTLRRLTTDTAYIQNWIYLLSEMVAQRLRRKSLEGRTVHFYISDGFGGGHHKQKTFYHPTYDGYEIYQRCLHIIKQLGCSHLQARVLAVSLSHLSPPQMPSLFEPQIRRDRLLHALDTINHRHGEWTIFPASLRDAEY